MRFKNDGLALFSVRRIQPSTSPRQTPTTNCCPNLQVSESHPKPTLFSVQTMYRQQANQGKLFSTVRGAHAEQQAAVLRLVEADLRTAWEDLEEGWDHLEKYFIEIGIVKSATSCGEDNMLCLNVGGMLVHVRHGMFEGRPFGEFFKGVWDERVPRDAAGCVVLDESPDCVQHLMRMLLASTSETRVAAPSPRDDLHAHDRAHLDYVSNVLGLAPLQWPLRAKTNIGVQPSMGMAALGQGSSLSSFQLARLMAGLRSWWPGEFRGMTLMYSSSRDGMNADAFHSRCGGDSCPTTTVARCSAINDSNMYMPPITIGGFSTASWAARSDGAFHFMRSEEAFIFAMKDEGDTKYELREGHADCAIYCGPNLGPCFGVDDLHLGFGANRILVTTGNQSSYSVPSKGYAMLGGVKSRTVSSIDVFRVHVSEVSAPSPASPAIPIPSTTDDVRCGINAMPEEMADDAHRFGASIASSLMEERVVLKQSQAELARAQEMASAALEALTNVYGPDIASGKKDEVVELSVRGVRMTTLRSTLTACPDSVFTTWFNGNWKPTEKDLDKLGRRMLDCKPAVFAKVLDVLRMKKRAGWAPSEDAGGGGVVVKPVPVAVRQADRACLEEFVNKYFPGCERFIMDLVVELPTVPNMGGSKA